MDRRPRVGRVIVEVIPGQTLELFHLERPSEEESIKLTQVNPFKASIRLIDGIEWMIPDDLDTYGLPVDGYPVQPESMPETRHHVIVGLDMRQAENEDRSIFVLWLDHSIGEEHLDE